ncbi:hypothetical protein PMG71_08305 [Roseofilum sp. BLCC_M154]|uniref:SGNH/GDSL hydrolase family protein n=1 Tax=Roseofilum acuticapitatum BLCC-M154 TaxID=3022444 RepID=A0ABT7AR94_9CYAN|nr:hypothetical protein [Roseofilum acuticapitatum]MDJ1169425.1 hypothetical protein [Roseofilum acuticapitatum BLCC-M154]
MKPYRSFTLILLSVAASGSCLVALFNAIIDPFGIIKILVIPGINQSKPATVDNTRLYKAVDLTRQDAKTIFLGASRVETAFDVEHPALQTYQPVYNLAMQGMTFYEQRRYLEYAIQTQENIQVVILGIDLWLLEDPYLRKTGFKEDRLQQQGLPLSESLEINFSWDTFSKSLESIKANLDKPDYEYYNSKGVRDTDYVKYRNVKFTSWLPGIINNPKDKIFPFALENLSIIVDLCRENNLNLIAFITPPHVTQFEAMYMSGSEAVIEQGKREIVNILPVWDFSGYNSITTEFITDQMTKYRDSSHFTMHVGDLILNRILQYNQEIVPEDFGIMIAQENIEEHLEDIRKQRNIWRKDNPDVVTMLEGLKR